MGLAESKMNPLIEEDYDFEEAYCQYCGRECDLNVCDSCDAAEYAQGWGRSPGTGWDQG